MDTEDKMTQTANLDAENPTTPIQKEEVESVISNAYSQYIGAIKKEITTPEYSKLSDQEVTDKLNAQFQESVTKDVEYPSRLEVISQEITNNDSIYLIPNLVIDNTGKITVTQLTFEQKLEKALQDEIDTDPTNRGYKNPNADIISLLSNAYVLPVTTMTDIGTKSAVILQGISYAPNAISLDDVTKARTA